MSSLKDEPEEFTPSLKVLISTEPGTNRQYMRTLPELPYVPVSLHELEDGRMILTLHWCRNGDPERELEPMLENDDGPIAEIIQSDIAVEVHPDNIHREPWAGHMPPASKHLH